MSDATTTDLPTVPKAYDWEAFRENGYKTIDFIVEHFRQVNSRAVPVQARVKPGYLAKTLTQTTCPEEPASWDDILKDVSTAIVPGLTLWQHPDFYAFFPAMVSPPAILGDMLANAFNNPGFNWVSCPAATETEMLVMNWLVDAFGLPEDFKWTSTGGGVLQPSATEAMIVVLLAARVEALARHSSDPTAAAKLVAYYSDQSHFCVEKAIKVLAVPHSRKIATKTNSAAFAGNHPVAAEDLQKQVDIDIAAGLIPFFVSANFGATGICAVDPIAEIANIARKHAMWLNIDAAYAGVVAICPEFRHMTAPIGEADSVLINGSKWFATMFNSNFTFFKRKSPFVCALNATGVYLQNSQTDAGAVVDFKDYHLGLGRPYRSLKIFTTLRSFGLTGLRSILRRHIVLAKFLGNLLSADPRFVVPVETVFALVSFTLAPPKTNEDCLALLERLNATEKMFIVHTMLDGRVIIRISLAHPQLTVDDMRNLFATIVSVAETL